MVDLPPDLLPDVLPPDFLPAGDAPHAPFPTLTATVGFVRRGGGPGVFEIALCVVLRAELLPHPLDVVRVPELRPTPRALLREESHVQTSQQYGGPSSFACPFPESKATRRTVSMWKPFGPECAPRSGPAGFSDVHTAAARPGCAVGSPYRAAQCCQKADDPEDGAQHDRPTIGL